MTKKQTRKSVSMPGYVYDAFQVACDRAGVPVAAQNERLVRAWLAEQTGETLASPEREPRKPREKRSTPTAPKIKKAGKRGSAESPQDPGVQAGDPNEVSRVDTPDGLLITYSNGAEIEHLNEPTVEMEAAGDPLAPQPEEPEVEYVDDREIVNDEDYERAAFDDVNGDGENWGG